jgi:hypothetical protein
MKQDKVVYLLGAGASCGAIPVLSDLRDGIDKAKNFLKDHFSVPKKTSKTFENDKRNLVADLDWLFKESGNHSTVDTLAKKYSLQGERSKKDLRRLKMTLCLYFTIEQLVYLNSIKKINTQYHFSLGKRIDLRYDSLLASIGKSIQDEKLTINEEIAIVSWNYDLQVEMAISRFTGSGLNTARNFHQIVPNFYIPLDKDFSQVKMDQFLCLKLNGSAFLEPWPQRGSNRFSPSIYESIDNPEYFVSELIDKYKAMEGQIRSIEFAWEHDVFSSPKITLAQELFKRAKKVIIIGYSFPYFNRMVDEIIFKDCDPGKIIIQDPKGHDIKDRLIKLFVKVNTPVGMIVEDRISVMTSNPYFSVED